MVRRGDAIVWVEPSIHGSPLARGLALHVTKKGNVLANNRNGDLLKAADEGVTWARAEHEKVLRVALALS